MRMRWAGSSRVVTLNVHFISRRMSTGLSGNKYEMFYDVEFTWYNKLKNPAAARLSRYALNDFFVIMSGEIKCSLCSRLISC